MKKRRLKLRSRFIISMLSVVMLISGVMAVMTYYRSRDALFTARQEELWELASANASELARRLVEVSKTAEGLSTTLEIIQPRREEDLKRLITRFLSESPRVYGLGVCYEPYRFTPGRRMFGIYQKRSPRGIATVMLGTNQKDEPASNWALAPAPKTRRSKATIMENYHRRDWYLLPLLLARPVWVQPYYGEAGKVLMTTYAAPILYKGKVQGVVTADINLRSLGREVSRLTVGREGYAFVLTRQGTFVAAPKMEWVMRESIFSLAEGLHRPDLRELGKRMVRGGRGVVKLTDWYSGAPGWLAFTPIKGPGWSFCAMVPESEVMEPVWNLARWQGTMAGAGILVILVLVWALVMSMTKPLGNLAGAARRLASGDLKTKVKGILPGDEIGDLAQAFNTMVDDLNRYVEELTDTTAAKERIESELNLAHQIQQSILPRTYPPFPDRPEFDLFAKTIPARQVGGDFYDFFALPDGRFGLVVGDVSGKGVPAALFMTVSRTLIKNAAFHHPDPLDALNEVNAQIIPDNEMCMFVTVFYGVYDPADGKLRYVSAGHPAPFLHRASTGEMLRLDEAHGRVVGVMDEMGLAPGEITLLPDDVFLVFTDGLDEAVNSDGEMFGLDRVGKWLGNAKTDKAPKMIDALVSHHLGFTGQVEQFDDLTLLIFRRKA